MSMGALKVDIFRSIICIRAAIYLVYRPDKEVREILTFLGIFLYFCLYMDIAKNKVDTCAVYEVRGIHFCYTVLLSIKKLNVQARGKSKYI